LRDKSRKSLNYRTDPLLSRAMAIAEFAHLPYRPCVGIMLINRFGLVWVGRRRPKWAGDRSRYIWQMPQGGIAPGEDPLAAALRELEEETGVRSVEVVATAPRWLRYDLPKELLGVALKGRYRGQRQRWFAMRFLGEEDEIDIVPRRGHKAEFDAWRWSPVGELAELVAPFKRQVYRDVIAAFAPIIAGQPA
jgi:putative (di)nucleoside polyphosphate hydrolase